MPNRLFAIGDIHGCFDPLRELVENQIHLAKTDTLVLLGDYIDRGPQSKAVVDYILGLQDAGHTVIPLMGNHEDMLLQALHSSRHLPLWLFNGGNKTLQSFGVRSPKNILPEYLEFFKNLKFWHGAEHYMFVHAGFNDDIANPFEDEYAMIWKCRSSYSHPKLKDKTIVHGHCVITPQKMDKQITGNRQSISVDTGCVYSEHADYGYLSAVELHSKEVYRSKCG